MSALLAEAERALPAARDGDVDAAQKLHRLLIDANCALDDAEALLEWPDLDAEARRCTLTYTPMVAQWGTPAEQQLYEQELEAAGRGAPAQQRRRAGAAPRRDAIARAGGVLPRPARDGRRDRLGGRARDRGDGRRAPRRACSTARARCRRRIRWPITRAAVRALRAIVAEIWELFPARPSCRRRASIRASDDRRRRRREPAARARRESVLRARRRARRRPSPRSSGRGSGCWRSWPRSWRARAATRRRSARASGRPSWCASAIAELRDPARRLAHEWWARGLAAARVTTVGAALPRSVARAARAPAPRSPGAGTACWPRVRAARLDGAVGDDAAQHRRVGRRVGGGLAGRRPRRS